MPMEEYLGWCEFFNLRPPGWNEDRRTYMLLSAFGAKEKPEKLFSSLAQMKKAGAQRDRSANPLGFFEQNFNKEE